MKALQEDFGSDKAVELPTIARNSTSSAWKDGATKGGGGNSKCYRMLMSLDVACEILNKGRSNYDLTGCTCDASRLTECKDYTIRHLKFNERLQAGHEALSTYTLHEWLGDSPAEIRMVELGIDFEQTCARLQMHTPSSKSLSDEEVEKREQRYYQLWIDLLVAQKELQMHDDRTKWSPSAQMFFDRPHTVHAMPIVVWLNKLKASKAADGPGNDGDRRVAPRARHQNQYRTIYNQNFVVHPPQFDSWWAWRAAAWEAAAWHQQVVEHSLMEGNQAQGQLWEHGHDADAWASGAGASSSNRGVLSQAPCKVLIRITELSCEVRHIRDIKHHGRVKYLKASNDANKSS